MTKQTSPTSFQLVSQMNTAFGNPVGDYHAATPEQYRKLFNQCKNIFDEYVELLGALGVEPLGLEVLKATHKDVIQTLPVDYDTASPNMPEVRDALCDVQVFALGAQHIAGVDGDADMQAVVEGVMSRFIKSEEDKQATIALHAAKGVTEVYFEGEYPRMVMKSAKDQPDAPKGKFLKSASYRNTVFPTPPVKTFSVTEPADALTKALHNLSIPADCIDILNRL